MNISTKLKVSALKSATSPSCKTLAVSLRQTSSDMKLLISNMCLFDLYNDPIFSGLLSSFIAAIFIYIWESSRRKIKSKKKYGKAEGEYKGYGYSNPNDTLNIKTEPQTIAKVTYLKENLLNIDVTEYPVKNDYHWSGIISMELENYGTITWKYSVFDGNALDENKHKFGVKKIILNEDDENVYLYLAEMNLVNGEEFGREIFKRKK